MTYIFKSNKVQYTIVLDNFSSVEKGIFQSLALFGFAGPFCIKQATTEKYFSMALRHLIIPN